MNHIYFLPGLLEQHRHVTLEYFSVWYKYCKNKGSQIYLQSCKRVNIDPRDSPQIFSTTGKDFQGSSRIAFKYFIWLLLRQT